METDKFTKASATVPLITSYYFWNKTALPSGHRSPPADPQPSSRARSPSLPPAHPAASCRERLQHQPPLRNADRGLAIPSTLNPEKSCTRNLKELLSLENTPQLKASFVLFCSLGCFLCVAFCAWTLAIYSVEGNAAFQEGSLKKLRELFGFARPAAWRCSAGAFIPPCLFLRVSVVTRQQLQRRWGKQTIKNDKILVLFCPEFLEDPRPDPWQTRVGITPSKSPEMCWLMPVTEPGLGWVFVITKTNLPPPATKSQDLNYSKLSQASKVKSCIFPISPLLTVNISAVRVSLKGPTAGLCCNWPWYI